jgi:excisionase family DNA binding protein
MKNPKNVSAGAESEFLRVSDARDILGFTSEKPIRRALVRGQLPYYRFGRTILLKREDLMASVKRVASRQEILC